MLLQWACLHILCLISLTINWEDSIVVKSHSVFLDLHVNFNYRWFHFNLVLSILECDWIIYRWISLNCRAQIPIVALNVLNANLMISNSAVFKEPIAFVLAKECPCKSNCTSIVESEEYDVVLSIIYLWKWGVVELISDPRSVACEEVHEILIDKGLLFAH